MVFKLQCIHDRVDLEYFSHIFCRHTGYPSHCETALNTPGCILSLGDLIFQFVSTSHAIMGIDLQPQFCSRLVCSTTKVCCDMTNLRYYFQSQGTISQNVNECVVGKSFWFDFLSNHQVRSQFCTCNNSWAVVVCAKLWPDIIIISHAKAPCTSTRFEL